MKNKKLLAIVVLSALGVSTALACGWGYWTDHSVRFNSMRTGRGFYRLPPLPIRYDSATGKEYGAGEIETYDEFDQMPYEEKQAAYARPEKIWEKVIAANASGDLSEIRKNLAEYLEQTKNGSNGDADFDQDKRNVASDVLDAMSELGKGASEGAVLDYVRARIGIQEGSVKLDSVLSTDGESEPTLRGSDRARLGDNWAYLRAAGLYAIGRKDEARAAFQEHSTRFPASEKNEAALYMIGRTALEKSHSFTENRCGIQGEKTWGGELDPADIEDPNKCRDEHWQTAMDRFDSLRSKFPSGRYANDARGWLAFLHKRGGNRAEALAEYYRLLGQTTDPQWRLEAKKSLQMIGHGYDDTTLDRVEALIANEPDAALAYAYHRIYNHAIDFSYEEFDDWCCTSGNWSDIEEEKKRVDLSTGTGGHELERLAKFSTAMIKRYGTSQVSGDFLLRLAQAQLELQNFRGALTFADKSIAAGVAGDSRAEALWVKGSSEHQMKKFDAARSTFTKLIAEFPKHKLTEGARRLLAMTAEDQGDLEGALDIYFDLGYQRDVAYFVDVLFSTDRFALYVAARNSNANYPILLYSLGVRYMRDGRWAEARDTFAKVKTERSRDDYLTDEPHPTRFFPKEPSYGYGEDRVTHIKPSWVMQDLKTIDVIEFREKELEFAWGYEAKAEAMYQLASAYFELDDLAFYNPAMWDGGRTSSLGELQFSAHERLPNETRIIFDHLQQHDPWAKAIPIYEELIAKYPISKAAQDALYTVAVSHEKLEGRNSVWSEIYRRGLFAGPRMVTYKDVRSIFPTYQLPRGTYGWEPSTRSVSGGPGWSPKPKPLPKLTTEQRVVRKVEKWVDKYGGTVWEKAVSVVTAVKNGIRDAALYVSGAIAGYLQNYYYLVYTGFLGAIFWANRKEIYEGPVTKGSFLAHRGLIFLGKHFRDWWVAVAVPSVIRVSDSHVRKEKTTPAEADTSGKEEFSERHRPELRPY